jgi:predicted XRE-type DNA-binding protein
LTNDDVVKELRDIKRLLVLLLQTNEVDQGAISKALRISQPAVSQMMNPKEKRLEGE